MKRVIICAAVLMTCVAGTAGADGDWSLSAQVRQRLEIDNRDFNSDTGITTFNLLRTRIGAKFTPNENTRAFIQLQDSRAFGEEPTTLTAIDNVDLHQAFLEVSNLFEQPVDLKVGRMEFNLGPQRLIGAVGWSNIGRAFDGAMLRVRSEKVDVNVFSLTEVENLDTEDRSDRFVHGMYSDLNVFESYTAQLFWIWQRQVPMEMLNRHTLGFYAARKGRLHHETEFAVQLGEITAGDTLQDVSAILAAVNVGIGFPDVAGKPDVTAGVDYLSGDDDRADTDFKVFDTMYATNHKYYGFMDYFLNIPVHTAGGGLIDVHGRLTLSPLARTTVKADYHYFASAEDVPLSDDGTGSVFGNEVDVILAHKYNENVAFTIGASVFLPGEIFEDPDFAAARGVGGDDTSTWFFVMTTFTAN